MHRPRGRRTRLQTHPCPLRSQVRACLSYACPTTSLMSVADIVFSVVSCSLVHSAAEWVHRKQIQTFGCTLPYSFGFSASKASSQDCACEFIAMLFEMGLQLFSLAQQQELSSGRRLRCAHCRRWPRGSGRGRSRRCNCSAVRLPAPPQPTPVAPTPSLAAKTNGIWA